MTSQTATARKLLGWPETLVDPSAFRHEQARLARVWTLLGHARDVAKDGDWFRTTLATRSVFVQRFGAELRAFENRCAHRSYPLRTKDKGNGPILCGLHHWRYDEDGRAVAIPQCQQLFGKSPREMAARLTPLEVATCGSLIFGRFRAPGDDQTLEDYLGESFPIVAAMFPASSAPQFLTENVEANWRLCFQIAVEDYHVPAVHAPVWGQHGYLKREHIGYYRFGMHSAFFTNSDPDVFASMAAECRAGTWRSANYRVFHLFPNLTVNHFRADGEHWYVMAMQYVPVAPDRSVMRAWYHPAPFAANLPWYDRWTRIFTNPTRRIVVGHYAKQVLRQDSGVCEKLQTIARQINAAPTFGGLEERIGWFEDAYETVVRSRTPPAASVDEHIRTAAE